MKNFRYFLIIVTAMATAFVANWRYQSELQSAKQIYIAEQHQKTHELTQKFNQVFAQLYQGLRTIARLPGVRSIDRHA